MNGERSTRALARIEAALGRIEAAAREAGGGNDDGAQLAALRTRHNRLRAVVQDQLQQLDLMIDGGRA